MIIYPGAVIGEAGFGLAGGAAGARLTPHFGRVIIQNGVSVGAGSCIDRGLLEDTVIGEGTHIDNLCHIGHNCRIGAHVVMAAFAGVSGSSEVGDGVQFGGRVGLKDHVQVGAGARIAAGAAVLTDVPAGETWAGYPAKPIRTWMRELAWLARAAQKRPIVNGIAGQSGQGRRRIWLSPSIPPPSWRTAPNSPMAWRSARSASCRARRGWPRMCGWFRTSRSPARPRLARARRSIRSPRSATRRRTTKYKGEDTQLIVGTDNRIREGAVLHIGTVQGRGTTVVGNRCLLMNGSHVGHDGIIGNGVTYATHSVTGGLAIVEDFVILGGNSAVHQLGRIGMGAFIGGCAPVVGDVIPFGMVDNHGRAARAEHCRPEAARRDRARRSTCCAMSIASCSTARAFSRTGWRSITEAFSHVPEVKRILDFIAAGEKRPLCVPRPS